VRPDIRDRSGPLFFATLAVALAFAWQSLAVRYNYSGNWTSLFCTGENLVQPPSLASEHIYRFPSSYGYDGQFYHYVAHDPLLRHGLDKYIDAPRLRYRRILVPGLAFVASAGQPRFLDAALIAVNLLFLFAGVYWLSRYVGHFGHQPTWGLLFLLIPAVVVSLDRLTVDMALTALAVGFALYETENQPRKLYAVLMLAPLARETGLLLTAASCLARLRERRFKSAAVSSSSALPALAWYGFVASKTATYGVQSWFTPVLFGGLIDRMVHPAAYPFPPALVWSATALDELALAGMLVAFILPFWLMGAKWLRSIQFAVLLIALSGLNLGKPFWEEAYAFGRVFSPLLGLLALWTCSSGSRLALAPVAMVIPRVGLQVGGQVLKVIHGLFA
jgi:hypothetical protein